MDDRYIQVSPVGVTGLKRQGLYVTDEWHNKLRGRLAIKAFREMSDNDAICGSILYAMRTYIQQAEVNVEPAVAGEPTAEMYAEHVRTCLKDMSMTWFEFLSDVLSMAWAGWSYHQAVYKIRRGDHELPELRSMHDDGRVGWRKLPIRAQDSIDGWKFQDDGGIEGAWQQSLPDYVRRFIPINGPGPDGYAECLLFRTSSNKNNPEGRSLLRNSWRSWFFLKRIQELEAIGVERDMAGVLVFQVPWEYLAPSADPTQKARLAEFRNMIERARRGEFEGFIIPSELNAENQATGFKLGLLQSGGRRPMDVDPIVKRLESREAVAMLGEGVLLGMQNNTGSWALSSSKTHMFAMGIGAIIAAIEDVFNTFAIPRLMLWNGWQRALSPRLVFGDIETEDSQELISALATGSAAGLITPTRAIERYILGRIGIPIEDKDVSPGRIQDAAGRTAESEQQTEPEASVPFTQELLRRIVPIPGDNRPIPGAAAWSPQREKAADDQGGDERLWSGQR